METFFHLSIPKFLKFSDKIKSNLRSNAQYYNSGFLNLKLKNPRKILRNNFFFDNVFSF